MKIKLRILTLSCALATLAGCAVGPDYVRPSVDVPVAYKEAQDRKSVV